MKSILLICLGLCSTWVMIDLGSVGWFQSQFLPGIFGILLVAGLIRVAWLFQQKGWGRRSSDQNREFTPNSGLGGSGGGEGGEGGGGAD